MEKHKCKLCFRSFSNGRALGGHMRSHMMNLPLEEEEEEEPIQLSEETELSYTDDEVEDDEKSEFYGLRENPKRSIRLVDPEFSFGVVDTGSIIVQDRESESESSKSTTRRRSKRTRKSVMLRYQYPRQQTEHEHINNNNKKVKPDQTEHEHINNNNKKVKPDQTESWVEQEPVSSISDTTTEEAVAFCLMMMSRDRKWNRTGKHLPDNNDVDVEIDVEGEETDESEEFKISSKNSGKYRCETCKKMFKSYQALGGHRASHKKMKSNMFSVRKTEPDRDNVTGTGTGMRVFVAEKKTHECPVCFRVFPSGQALGGHKRSHGTQLIEASRSSIKFNESLIDLNLPAPIEDDEFSQFEFSAEFVNHFVR